MNVSKFIYSAVFLMIGMPASADVTVGLWEAKPDRRGIVLDVRTKSSGAAICGQIERAKDRRGYDKPSTDLAWRMLLDIRAQTDGSYAGEI